MNFSFLGMPMLCSMLGINQPGRHLNTADRYINTISGNDGNDGLTPATAYQTFTPARTALSGGGGGTIAVHSTEASPLTLNGDTHYFNAGSWVLLPMYQGDYWYAEGPSFKYTSGWSAEGGSVYSRVADSARTYVLVDTLTDADGNVLVLAQNTGTPTAPAAGEYGLSGGNLYVHLPGSVDPAGHTVIHTSNKSPLYGNASSGTISLDVRYARIKYAFGWICAIAAQGTATYALSLSDCYFEYASDRVIYLSQADTGTTHMNATRVTCRCAFVNDGFGLKNANSATLINCLSEYNADEGYSTHETFVLIATDCTARYNQSGGFTAVDSSQMDLTRCVAHNNGRGSGAQGERGGYNYLGHCTGSNVDCEARDNTGEGYNCTTDSGGVTVSGLTSGIANGNTLADVSC